jgi:hypothetical protein
VTVVAAVCGVGGCLLGERVNHPPIAVIQVLDDDTMIHQGLSLRFVATGSSDADAHLLSYAWSARRCAAPTDCNQFLTASSPEFTVGFETKQPVIVTLTVTDERGAVAEASRTYTPENQLPTVTLQLTPAGPANATGCYTAGRTLDFYAEAADPDGDAIDLAFLLTVIPPASNPNVREDGAGAQPGTWFVRPDAPGNWTLTATVTDSEAATASDDQAFCVDAAAPPCAAALDPFAPAGAVVVVERDAGPRRFSVEIVSDDLDPYPYPGGSPDAELGGAHFAWFLGAEDAPPSAVPGHDVHDFVFDPSAYAPGERLWLRVEVTDRVARASCDPILASCGTPECPQRVTWTLEVR